MSSVMSSDLYHNTVGKSYLKKTTLDLDTISRATWREHCHACLESSQLSSGNVDLRTVACRDCLRCFRLISDLKRHKFIAARHKPKHQQTGAIECQTCKRYFRRKGGYSVHICIDMHRGLFVTLSLSPLKG